MAVEAVEAVQILPEEVKVALQETLTYRLL